MATTTFAVSNTTVTVTYTVTNYPGYVSFHITNVAASYNSGWSYKYTIEVDLYNATAQTWQSNSTVSGTLPKGGTSKSWAVNRYWNFDKTRGNQSVKFYGNIYNDDRDYEGYSAAITVTPKDSYSITYAANGGSSTPGTQTKWYNEVSDPLRAAISRANTNPAPYVVTLNPNGGSVTPTALSATRTTSYSFYGWKCSANGIVYSAYDTLPYSVNQNCTMTAQWSSSTSTAWVTLPTANSAVSRQNFKFDGWYTAASGGTKVNESSNSYLPAGSVTLYAHWTQVYASPQLNIVKVYRSDIDGNQDDEGSYASIVCTYSIWYLSGYANTVSTSNPPKCTVEGSTGSAYATAVSGTGYQKNTYSSPDGTGTWRTGRCFFVVNASMVSEESYSVSVELRDTLGGSSVSGGVSTSSNLVTRSATIPTAFFTMDVLGDAYLYQHPTTVIDSNLTYYVDENDEWIPSDSPSEWNNLARAHDASHTPTAYDAYRIYLDEALVAEQQYTLTLRDVSVQHLAKAAADIGVCVYYCGSSVRLGGWYGTTNFTFSTNYGTASVLTMTFTPHASSAATTSTTGHAYAGSDNDLSHATVPTAVSDGRPFLVLYNSVPSVSGTMNMTVGSWKLQKGGTASAWTPAFGDIAYLPAGPRPGHGIAFGGPAKAEGFHVNMPVTIDNATLGTHETSSAFVVKDPVNFPTSQGTPSPSAIYGDLVSLVQGGIGRAYLRAVSLADGRQGIQMEALRVNASGTNVYHGIQMFITADGTRSVILSDPAAWRSALGFTLVIGAKDLTVTDTTARAAGANYTITITMTASTGYMPLSVLAAKANNGNVVIRGFDLDGVSTGGTPVLYIYCHANAAVSSATYTAQIIHIKPTLG